MKSLLRLTLILSALAAGCAWERSTAPQTQEHAWNLVRFHETAGGTEYSDISVRTDGELTLVDGRGDGMSERGLLAGEKLETLARLIDALPPHSYVSSTPCPTDGFFVSVTRGGEVLNYASASCDADAPAVLVSLRELFSALSTEALEHRANPVAFQVLAAGTNSAIHEQSRQVIRDRDALMRLLAQLRPGQPVAIPRVDFSRQIVVAEFLGNRPTGGYAVTVDAVERTDSGWLRVALRRITPGPSCPVTQALTQPYVIVAVDAQDENVLFDTADEVSQCS